MCLLNSKEWEPKEVGNVVGTKRVKSWYKKDCGKEGSSCDGYNKLCPFQSNCQLKYIECKMRQRVSGLDRNMIMCMRIRRDVEFLVDPYIFGVALHSLNALFRIRSWVTYRFCYVIKHIRFIYKNTFANKLLVKKINRI